MKQRFTLLPLTILLTTALASAQGNEAAETAVSPATMLAQALDKASKTEVSLTGTIADRSEKDGGGLGGAMMVLGGGGPGGKQNKFTGKIEAVVNGRNAFLCTKKSLPGAAVLSNGRETLVQKTQTASKGVNTSPLSEDAVHLLNFKRLSKEVARAERRAADGKRKSKIVVKTAEDGTHTIQLPVRTTILPEVEGGMMSMMQPKIMGVAASFVMSKDGALQSMTLTVTRSDPMAALRKQAMNGGGRIEITDPSDLESDELEEGAKTEFKFEMSTKKLSKRAESARKRLAALLEQ